MAAIKTAKTYVQIGLGLEAFKEEYPVEEIPFMLMGAIGASPSILQRYREGKSTVASFDGLLVKNILAYRLVRTEEMNAQLEAMKRDKWVVKNKPAIIAVSDGDVIKAFDPAVEETYENHLNNVFTDYEFFSPMWGVRKIRNIEENEADVKAAYKMAQIHDEIRRFNQIGITDDTHDLNIFMSRLLFCFFAEDTGIFEKDLFTNAINNTTRQDSSDLQDFFDGAFRTMDLQLRIGVNSRFAQFPYVNGGLFSKAIQVPRMNGRIRRLIIECGNLNWAKINPDIFGSMIQAVVSPELRSGLGMHYTSVSNIKKVINPLFLDELYEEYHTIERKQKEQNSLFDDSGKGRKEYYDSCRPLINRCKRLLTRMSRMKFFDPACGSGNFLIITYKELRTLEMKILKLMQLMQRDVLMQFLDGSVIGINQFYGLEINDFACETAVLSLWLAEHQMNNQFTQNFGVDIRALPLKENHNFHCGNACHEDWNKVCPHKPDEEVYIMGNPPYLGSKLQSEEQKKEVVNTFSNVKNCKILDYIANWFLLGANYIKGTRAKYAFVSTNSICQGEQVGVLWPELFKRDVNIFFAHKSFKWTNNAKYNAGVTCLIVGICNKGEKVTKRLFDRDRFTEVNVIGPYLTSNSETIVYKKTKDPSGLPKLCFGCMPYDDKNNKYLRLDEYQRQQLLEDYPEAGILIRRIFGSEEFIKGKKTYCLWIDDNQLELANSIPPIKQRIEANWNFRLYESEDGQELANRPHQFREHPEDKKKVIVPSVSSEHREYIPMAFLDEKTIVSNAAFALYDAPEWLFGILTSAMHMAWVRAIGGRLETRYRYSAGLCYNTFPFPNLTEAKKKEIEDAAMEIEGWREYYNSKTLAWLYDPETMPQELREAHHKLDLIVDSCYREHPFADENERLEWLLKLYEKMK